ncbi:hypothetical protein LMS44_22170 [Halomonas profundus]|nr:hypothetical protein [Halomonas titanicae]UEQ03948.1 hypothetical protein LMS44_22170 [Halomonas profundus]SDI79699.1 NitT/TauT family transport system substrate-binding protein [Halomonas titanicae]
MMTSTSKRRFSTSTLGFPTATPGFSTARLLTGCAAALMLIPAISYADDTQIRFQLD